MDDDIVWKYLRRLGNADATGVPMMQPEYLTADYTPMVLYLWILEWFTNGDKTIGINWSAITV